jgi:tetratricopeptide (TPR) repeat protein
MRPRWTWVLSTLGLFSLLAVFGGWNLLEKQRDRSVLAVARDAMREGRWTSARADLSALLKRRPGWDEALYELGVCELARGRKQAALDAWSQVPENSPLQGWILVRRSRIEMDQGRFDACESLLRLAADRAGRHRAEARWGMVLLLRLEGRLTEARDWLQQGFDQMTDPVETLQRLYRLDHDLFPSEGVRQSLDRAGKQSAEDDRVWLGKAHLATKLGEFDEGKVWLDRCQKSRPDDPAVWRMRLTWALAAGRPEDARACLPHLPARLEDQSRPPALRAWFAQQASDRVAERRALEHLLLVNPGESQAMERLGELLLEAGQPAAAAGLRLRKRETEETRKSYQGLLFTERPIEHAAELARLAGRLGRWFEARQWAALAAAAGASDTTVANGPKVELLPLTMSLADLLPEIARSPLRADNLGPRSSGSLPQFTDAADAAGLHFVQENGGAGGGLIPPVTSSGGVGLIDIDNDGWLDVYVVQGGTFPPREGTLWPGDRLFRNRGDGSFEDVTARSGIGAMPRGYGHGVAVGDFDNDGHADLFVTRWRSYALYRNRGDGTFEDVTAASGLGGDRDWPTSAAFADLDGDGDLDLYVCHYLKWDEHDTRTCVDPDDPTIYRCSPLDFEALPDHLFRNDKGRFVDVTREAGIADRDGRGLGVLAADLDGDGRMDLFVANDMTANFLFRNLGNLRFEEVGLTAGVAGNASGGFQAGMGVACADLDGDGRPDLAVTNFYNESTSFFRNLGRGFFGEESAAIGLAGPSRYLLGFGIVFFDADNDGWLDLMTANGHVHDGRPQYPWKMPVRLYRNSGGPRPRLNDISAHAGPPFQVPRMGRGMAAGDLDNDGRVDAVVVSQGEPLVFLHNRSSQGHFLTLLLEGKMSNRDSVGAQVTVRAGGQLRVAQRIGGGSYQSASDPRLHFGLGKGASVDGIEVRWPSGHIDRYAGVQGDSGYLLREGEGSARTLVGWKKPR